MIRSFIAIDVPEEFKKEIKDLQDKLKECGADVRWVKPGAMHFTLKFLGNIEEKQIDGIKKTVAGIANNTPSINIKLAGTGVFPNKKMPRVLWVGIEDENGTLEQLHKRIDAELSIIGFEKEGRDFRPHLTLGRIRSQKGKEMLVNLLENVKDKEFGFFTAAAVRLMKSELRPEGSVYTELARFEFKKA